MLGSYHAQSRCNIWLVGGHAGVAVAARSAMDLAQGFRLRMQIFFLVGRRDMLGYRRYLVLPGKYQMKFKIKLNSIFYLDIGTY